MQKLPNWRDAADPDPRITVLPHISAPIDEGPFYPTPPRSLWQTLFYWLIGLVIGGFALGYLFVRATALH